jgi:hypothetical protein
VGQKRTTRFYIYAGIAFAALFTVLAVKAQIIPAPTWQNLPPYYETTR